MTSIVGTPVVVLVVLVGTTVALSLLLARSVRAERALRESEARVRLVAEAALAQSHQETQHLAGRLIEAQDTERARIARDLHDDVSQQLAGVSIAFSGLKQTPRQHDILRLIVKGQRMKEIAATLGLSTRRWKATNTK